MKLTRRSLLQIAGSLPLSGVASSKVTTPLQNDVLLPDKDSFESMPVTYLDSGSQHPLAKRSSEAAATYFAKRRYHPDAPGGLHDSVVPLNLFAELINASPDEVAYVQSTTAGEQMVLRALGLPESGGHIVTDRLHFQGSMPIYEGMARNGAKVTWIDERDGRISIDDISMAVRKGTKLVSLSLVSTHNGFQHDLKAVCDIAHANGALVYADIVHAAGCVPLDVKESGVDFAACASYKWLMGDFGLGFLYVNKDVLPQLKQTNFGYFGLNISPDSKEEAEANFGYPRSTSGYFALGTRSFSTVAILEQSLEYILGLGVERIQAHSQLLVNRLKEVLPDLGYKLHTPQESEAPIVTCRLDDARTLLGSHLHDAGLKISLYDDHFRVTPSVFNDMDDIELLLDVLKQAG